MPGFDVKMTITGIQEAQRKNEQDIRAVQPRGALGEAIKAGTIAAQRHAIYVTHVASGALKASHRMQFRDAGSSTRGTIYIDPGAVNPSGQQPADYGPIEHERGGGHAFYDRVVDEKGEQITRMMQNIVTKAMAD